MQTHEGMKAIWLHAHQMKLDKDFVWLIRTVKSNATDSEAHEVVLKELADINLDEGSAYRSILLDNAQNNTDYFLCNGL